jgi:transcription antitermination protein NusB
VPEDGARARSDEGPRRQARERALALLYEAEMKGVAPGEVLRTLPARPDPFSAELVEGVAALEGRIDGLIVGAAQGWELSRMPVLDRCILRIATYELVATPATPVAVVIDEAVELANQYSTAMSGRFVNGVLSTIAREVRG